MEVKTLVSKTELSDKAMSCPTFTKPKEIGSFTLDSHRNFHFGTKNLRHYRKPKIPSNLADGYPSRYSTRDESIPEYIDFILQFIHEQQKAQPMLLKDVQIVAYRGLFTKIMAAYHAKKDSLQFAVQKFNGQIYLCEFETQDRQQERASMPDEQRKVWYDVTCLHLTYRFIELGTAGKLCRI
jgi:RAT1-interacting protein